MEIGIDMEIAVDEQVETQETASSSTTAVSPVNSVGTGFSHALSLEDCIFCCGTSVAQERGNAPLKKAGADGLKTIKSHCDSCRDSALLAFLDANYDKQILYHHICRNNHIRNAKKRKSDSKLETVASPIIDEEPFKVRFNNLRLEEKLLLVCR